MKTRQHGKASMLRDLFFVLLAIASPALFSACGGGSSATPPFNNSGTGVLKTAFTVTCPADDSLVSKVSMSATSTEVMTESAEYFSPFTVSVSQNGIVKWTDDIADPDPFWYWQIISDTGAWITPDTVYPGQSVCLQFTKKGTYRYHCASSVKGEVIVQ